MRLSHEYFMSVLADPIFLNRVKIHVNDDFKTRSIQVTHEDACKYFWIKVWTDLLIPSYKKLEFYREINANDLTIHVNALDYPEYNYVNLLGVPPTWTELYYVSTIGRSKDSPFLKPIFYSLGVFICYLVIAFIIAFYYIFKL